MEASRVGFRGRLALTSSFAHERSRVNGFGALKSASYAPRNAPCTSAGGKRRAKVGITRIPSRIPNPTSIYVSVSPQDASHSSLPSRSPLPAPDDPRFHPHGQQTHLHRAVCRSRSSNSFIFFFEDS